MATTRRIISSEWVQIGDGTEAICLQVNYGCIYLVDATDKPDSHAKGYRLRAECPESYGVCTITPPSVAWVRSAALEHAEITF